MKTTAGRGKWVIVGVLGLAVLGAAAWYWRDGAASSGATASSREASRNAAAGRGNARGARRNVVPVKVAAVRNDDIRVYFASLGTVTTSSSVVVRPRVDGLLAKVFFKEGDEVRAGQQIALIDPRQFEVQLAQAEGQLAKDTASASNARNDLARYKQLLAEESISRQQVDTQQALVQQYEGSLKSDQAQVDSARLQLSFTRVLAPASGRLGLRQVDVGNLVKSSDANGLVSINQVRPINVTFTLSEAQLPSVLKARRDDKKLTVEAWDREQKHVLAKGKLASMDNQIDTATGTVKMRAVFANDDESMFPNQFVNVRVLAETHADAIVAPAAAVQRGRDGAFVYLVKEDKSVTQRRVKLGAVDGLDQEMLNGLQPGDVVVVDGIDQLREGARVEVADASKLLKQRPRGKRRGPGGDASGPQAAPDKADATAPAAPAKRAGGDAAPHADSPRQSDAPAKKASAEAPSAEVPRHRPGGGEAASTPRPGAASARPDFEHMTDEQRAALRAKMQQSRQGEGGGTASGPAAAGRPDFANMTDEQRAAFRAEMRRRREEAGKQDKAGSAGN